MVTPPHNPNSTGFREAGTKTFVVFHNTDATASCSEIWVEVTAADSTFVIEGEKVEEPKVKKGNPFMDKKRRGHLERWQR